MKAWMWALVLSPVALVLGAKVALDPSWLRQMSLAACIGLGAGIGAYAVVAKVLLDDPE